MISRRHMLGAAAALLAFRGRAHGQPKPAKTLVVVFLRGGVDGLSMVPPVADPRLVSLRPSLRLLPPDSDDDDAALALDATFGLHPALAPLLPLYTGKRLAVIHAVGQPSPSRSHFDAQDFLESGTPGRKAHEGWLNRALGLLPASDKPLRAVAVQTRLPMSLIGPANALAFGALKDFRLGGSGTSFEAMYAHAVDQALRGAGQDAFDTIAALDGQQLAKQPPRNDARYPNGALGKRLQDVARLIHADVGLEVCATEAGGFDTHLAQGAGKGQLATRLTELGSALAAFAQDLGPKLDDVCVVTVTEFGRTVRENGSRGTDHGTASAMFVLGGRVKGGRVLADWPGLADLHEGRDLKATTDVRAVLAEILARHLELRDPAAAFPGLTWKSPQTGLFT